MIHENMNIDMFGITLDSALMDASPYMQLNIILMLNKCRSDLSEQSLQIIEKYLPKICDYNALKMAIHILLEKCKDTTSLIRTLDKVELAWVASERRLNLVAAAKKRLSLQ